MMDCRRGPEFGSFGGVYGYMSREEGINGIRLRGVELSRSINVYAGCNSAEGTSSPVRVALFVEYSVDAITVRGISYMNLSLGTINSSYLRLGILCHENEEANDRCPYNLNHSIQYPDFQLQFKPLKLGISTSKRAHNPQSQ